MKKLFEKAEVSPTGIAKLSCFDGMRNVTVEEHVTRIPAEGYRDEHVLKMTMAIKFTSLKRTYGVELIDDYEESLASARKAVIHAWNAPVLSLVSRLEQAVRQGDKEMAERTLMMMRDELDL